MPNCSRWMMPWVTCLRPTIECMQKSEIEREQLKVLNSAIDEVVILNVKLKQKLYMFLKKIGACQKLFWNQKSNVRVNTNPKLLPSFSSM